MQRNANQVFVQNDTNKSTYLQADANISITDLCLTQRNMLLTNGRTVHVYKITIEDDLADVKMNKGLSIKLMNTFAAECIQLFIHDENIIVLGQIDVKIFSLGGVVLRELHFNDNEGEYNVLFSVFCCWNCLLCAASISVMKWVGGLSIERAGCGY